MLKTLWNDVKSEDVRKNVIATILSSILITLVSTPILVAIVILLTGEHKVENFPTDIASFLRTPIPVWIAFTCFFVMGLLSFRRRGNRTTSIRKSATGLPELLFDSSKANRNWFAVYGNTDWRDNAPLGEMAFGRFDFNDHIVTITREDTIGKFEVIPKHYHYKGTTTQFVPPNPGGDNPRTISITFSHRSIAGNHRIIVILTRPNFKWIDSEELVLSLETWQAVNITLLAKPTDEFVIEFQIFSRDADSGYQLKDLLIREASSSRNGLYAQ